MIKKIAIVPYVTNGRNSQVGHDGHFNIFKKKRSTVLKLPTPYWCVDP